MSRRNLFCFNSDSVIKGPEVEIDKERIYFINNLYENISIPIKSAKKSSNIIKK